jgi:hypothetical protein
MMTRIESSELRSKCFSELKARTDNCTSRRSNGWPISRALRCALECRRARGPVHISARGPTPSLRARPVRTGRFFFNCGDVQGGDSHTTPVVHPNHHAASGWVNARMVGSRDLISTASTRNHDKRSERRGVQKLAHIGNHLPAKLADAIAQRKPAYGAICSTPATSVQAGPAAARCERSFRGQRGFPTRSARRVREQCAARSSNRDPSPVSSLCKTDRRCG